MKTVMKAIRFPVDILEEIRPIIDRAHLKFTGFVIEAVKNYIRTLDYRRSIDKSFGAWKRGKHPELKNGVKKYVQEMREGR